MSKVSSVDTSLFIWENIPVTLMQKTEDYAVSFYFASYGRAPPSRSEELKGFQHLILPLFAMTAEDSALKMSTMALATLFFNTWNAPLPENPLSRSYYVKALAAMKLQLKQKDQCSNDEMIMSVLILELFEVNVTASNILTSTYIIRNSLLDRATSDL